MGEIALSGQRFRRIPYPYFGQSADVDSLLNDDVEPWPHLKELLKSYTADWVKDESKYGHYESVPPPTFENQIFEGPDTDVETELRFSNIKLGRHGDRTEDEDPTTSGRYSGGLYSGRFSGRSTGSDVPDSIVTKAPKHYGGAPLPPYEPVFNWRAARASVFGQRITETPTALSPRGGLRVSVKVVSLSLQAGLVEPWYGTLCLYHREKREKLSEDFHFRWLPAEFQDETSGYKKKAIFSIEEPSPAICLLVQLEKHVTEEGGVTPSMYTRKEPLHFMDSKERQMAAAHHIAYQVHLTEKEKQKLQVWARVMPFREPFAWSTVALFDATVTGGVGGFSSSPTNSPLPSGILGSALMEGSLDSDGRLIADSKTESAGISVLVDVPDLHRVKDNYTEEMLLIEHTGGHSGILSFQDPKRKVHKPVKATLRLEIERLGNDNHEADCISEFGSFSNGSFDADSRSVGASLSGRSTQGLEFTKALYNAHQKSSPVHRDLHSSSGSSLELRRSEFRAVEFRLGPKPEPFSQLLHCLYVYPQSVLLNRKRNLFIRLELRNDDSDIRKPPLEALYPRDADSSMQKYAHSQIDTNTKTPHFHDEFKVQLPANLSPQHHLLFTFFHVELQMKNEVPKPVVVGYAVLPLLFASQVIRLDDTLPIAKELYPNYLQDYVKDRLEYLDDGRMVFKLRARLCSSLYPVNERIRDFFSEYDRHVLRTSSWGNELMEAINALKNVEASAMLQFLQPCLNMLLRMIGDGGETLQVAAFRSMVNIVTRVQGETSDGAERNRYLVQYLDFAFDDFGGRHDPVYPGLSSVWRSLARSKAKGYRVGPVYDDVLSMAWVFLELIVKSMALEQSLTYGEALPPGEELPPLQLNDEVFKSIGQLFDCLLSEVQERGQKGLIFAKKLNSSLGFFCLDLLSVVEPQQVFEFVALYFNRFSGVCETVIHEYKLDFLRIICDHDLFVEMPGRDPSERNYLASVLMQEVFITWDHEEPALKAKACRIFVQLLCKHEYDARYQTLDDKLFISQCYFPLVGLILDEMPVFYGLRLLEKRETLVCVLHILRYLDDASLLKAWQQNVARTRLFFMLLEECLELFEFKKAGADGLMGAMPASEQGEGPLRYSEKLSPVVNHFLAEASRQDTRLTKSSPGAQWIVPQASSDASTFWKRVSPASNSSTSPNQPHSLREALTQAQSAGSGAAGIALKESLHPMLRQKLELWEENLSASVMLQLLEIVEKFMEATSIQAVATDYTKLDCITSIVVGFLGCSQPLPFWKAFLPIFNNLFSQHGAILMSRDNYRFLKQVAFHLLRLGVFRNESIRKRAVVGLQILVRTAFHYFQGLSRLRVLLTITLSELMSDVQVTQQRMDGSLEESGESQRLRRSLRQIAQEHISADILRECGLSENTLIAMPVQGCEQKWSWTGVTELSKSLLKGVEAAVGHALLGPEIMTIDKYATAEAYYGLARAYSNVPDLHIMWLLYLCEVHQGNQSYAEAAQCAVAVAGVIMQAIVGEGDYIWGKEHVEALRKICPMLTGASFGEAASAEIEGYGSSKLTVESAVKYLQLANKLFVQGDLFHFCADILELIIPVYKARGAYEQLSKCHTSLTSIYEAIVEQESSPIPFSDATYYRVGFYGKSFGTLNCKEYVYREARDVRLGDIMRNLGNIYEPRVIEGKQSLHNIPDSRQVNLEDLQPEICYMQITSVEPVTEDEDLESRRERQSGHKPAATVSARVFNRFLFDTPFTKNGKSQGGLEDQWKRRTLLQTESPFPALVNRLRVVKSESREFSPIENAIGMIETRTVALAGELDDHRLNDGDHLPRLQSLQRILQGSVAVQVNSGVLGVCAAFLSGEPTRLSSQELQQLIAALLEFMAVCKKALRVHARLIGEEDQEFHSQLVIGFQSLTAELSHFIPAILSEL